MKKRRILFSCWGADWWKKKKNVAKALVKIWRVQMLVCLMVHLLVMLQAKSSVSTQFEMDCSTAGHWTLSSRCTLIQTGWNSCTQNKLCTEAGQVADDIDVSPPPTTQPHLRTHTHTQCPRIIMAWTGGCDRQTGSLESRWWVFIAKVKDTCSRTRLTSGKRLMVFADKDDQ